MLITVTNGNQKYIMHYCKHKTLVRRNKERNVTGNGDYKSGIWFIINLFFGSWMNKLSCLQPPAWSVVTQCLYYPQSLVYNRRQVQLSLSSFNLSHILFSLSDNCSLAFGSPTTQITLQRTSKVPTLHCSTHSAEFCSEGVRGPEVIVAGWRRVSSISPSPKFCL